MSIKISEKNKPRIGLVVILIVFVSITAYSMSVESKAEITVEEGYEELNIEYLNSKEKSIEHNKTATATTKINGEESLNLSAELLKSVSSSKNSAKQKTGLKLIVEGDLDSKFSPSSVKLLSNMTKGGYIDHLDYQISFTEYENLTPWQPSENDPGSIGEEVSFVGFDIKDNHFTMETVLTWVIYQSNQYEDSTSTLTIKAEITGLEEPVLAQIDVHISKGREI